MKLAIRLKPTDNVATVTNILKRGELVLIFSEEGKKIDNVNSTTDVPLPFHKIALIQINKGEEVKKYGEIIGYASEPIDKGEWIHVHNIESVSLPEKEIT